MKNVALAEAAGSEARETISEADIRVMMSMIEYLFTEIDRIDPVAAYHLQEARASLVDTVMPSAPPRAH
jgi:Pyruvate/2-oxoacid:ferredoxin oxidoreductase gamma subunit